MPNLDPSIIDEIVTKFITKFTRGLFERDKYSYKMVSQKMRDTIVIDLKNKLASIPLSSDQIKWISETKAQFIAELVGSIQHKPYNGNQKSKNDYCATSGLVKVYYNALPVSIPKDLLFSGYVEYNPNGDSNAPIPPPCIKDNADLSKATNKSISNVIRDLYIKTLTPSQLYQQMQELHDDTEPRTQFLRTTRNPVKKLFKTYSDTFNWTHAVNAVKSQAKTLLSTEDLSEGDKRILDSIDKFDPNKPAMSFSRER